MRRRPDALRLTVEEETAPTRCWRFLDSMGASGEGHGTLSASVNDTDQYEKPPEGGRNQTALQSLATLDDHSKLLLFYSY
jgi:hypothetical protein